MRIALENIQLLAPNIVTFWFKPPKPVRYTAGQFIEMTLPHSPADERGQKHWFTLSSSPTERLISVTTKNAGDKNSSFKRTLFSLQLGYELEISDPMGDFVLPKDKTIPLVFVAGGIGVTPFRSMVKWLLDTGEKRSIQVILAAKTEGDIVFEELFHDYGAELVKVLGKRLTAKKILDIVGEIKSKRIYVSGPELMVEALEANLQKLGVAKDQLVGDYFPGYKSI